MVMVRTVPSISKLKLIILTVGIFLISSFNHVIIASEIAESASSSSPSDTTCGADGQCHHDDRSRESTADNSHNEDATKTDGIHSVWAFKDSFSKLGSSWTSVLGEYISVVGNADGKDIRGDVYADSGLEEGLLLLQLMVKDIASQSQENELAWTFRTSPLHDFGKTTDDILLAFLRWSMVDNSGNENNGGDGCSLIGGVNKYASTSSEKVNVSKAFRRLTAYVQWMESVSEDLLHAPLTHASVANSLSIFSIHATHDLCGRLIWWVNLGKTDIYQMKTQPPRETTRMFVWVAHLLFLDEGAQTKGLVVVDDMSHIGFWEYMTMLPLHVGISVDRFLISVTPLKAKNVVLMHRPKWAEIGYSLLSWFLTSKMKSRVTMVERGEEIDVLNKVVGGAEFIPTEFSNVKGEITADLISIHR